ncbi:MAG: DUF952 domain-containing protein [Hyphomicrobiales bacterium]
MTLIYKICPKSLWSDAKAKGVFEGAPVDIADGYIHFSSAEQLRETANKHFAGLEDLLLIAVDSSKLEPALKWEPSRGGALFPHLYDALDPANASWIKPLSLGSDGAHEFPPLD